MIQYSLDDAIIGVEFYTMIAFVSGGCAWVGAGCISYKSIKCSIVADGKTLFLSITISKMDI